ncbi:MAG TPA: hypothetical protein VHT91_00365 [Kofleriaceae bacterium]|jgi:hypothetical protein|nr:hypothetical protein [Kofleriaceae bacterium]
MVTWLSAAVIAAFDAEGNITGRDVDDAAAQPHVIRLPHDRNQRTMSAFRDGGLVIDWKEGEDRRRIGVLARDGLRVLAEHVASVDSGMVAAPSQQAVYFTNRYGAVNDLVRAPRAGGELQTVGGGVSPSHGFAISADGRRLAFSTCKRPLQLVRIEDNGRLVPVPVMESGDWDVYTPVAVDDRHLLFSSNRTGSLQLFVLDGGSGRVHAVGPRGGGELGGVSQDRRWFAYVGRAPAGIWLGAIDGATPPRRLTDDASDTEPVFSQDDRHVIFVRWTGGRAHLWIVPAAGGAARQLTATPSRIPMTSAADKRIFFLEPSALGYRLMVTDERGGAAAGAAPPMLARTEGNTWGFARSRDGRRILIVRGGYEIVEVDVDSDRPPRVKHRLNQWIVDVNYAADDQHVIAVVNRGEGNIWLAEGEFP